MSGMLTRELFDAFCNEEEVMNENAQRFEYRKGPTHYIFVVHESGDVQVEARVDGVTTRKFMTTDVDARGRIAKLKQDGFVSRFA